MVLRHNTDLRAGSMKEDRLKGPHIVAYAPTPPPYPFLHVRVFKRRERARGYTLQNNVIILGAVS